MKHILVISVAWNSGILRPYFPQGTGQNDDYDFIIPVGDLSNDRSIFEQVNVVYSFTRIVYPDIKFKKIICFGHNHCNLIKKKIKKVKILVKVPLKRL